MPTFSAPPYQLTPEDITTLIGFIRSGTGTPPAWSFEDVEASHTVLVDETTLPDAPTHDGNIDNLRMINRAADFTEMVIEVEVWDLEHLQRIMAGLRIKPMVSKVERFFS